MSEAIEKETTDLALLPPAETALQVYQQPAGLDPYIERIRAEVTGHVPDLTTDKGRKAIASLAFKVRKSKTALDALGKQLVDDLKEIPKKIDAERKRMRDQLDALADEVRKPLTEWEEAEEARVDHHKRMIQHIKDCALGMIGGEPQPYAILFRELEEKIVIDNKWEEFEAEAHRTKTEALARLKASFAAHQQREAEQAELAELRRKQAEQERKDREAMIAQQAADKAKAEAEAAAREKQEAAARREAEAKAAQERAERERLEAIERQKQAEARVEAEKLAAEQRAKEAAEAARLAEIKRQADEAARIEAEQRKREADKAHKAKVNRAALDAFTKAGMPEDCAKQAIKLIARGEIPAITINY